MLIRATVNGLDARGATSGPATSLLTLLRDELGLTGSKNACEQGECGSCSVWLDGELVCSCLVPAAQADGATVRTVESLADGDELHAVQDAFLEAGAVQCGFCTPGLVVAAADLLERDPHPTDDDDPRGARRQPLPLHRLPEDPRRGSHLAAGALGVSTTRASADRHRRERAPRRRHRRR